MGGCKASVRGMDAREISEVLYEIATLLELKGENPFKVRAYQSGARTLESLEEDLGTLIAEERLDAVKGIGSALTSKIISLHREGRLEFYDKLKESVAPGLLEMLEIPGFGPKKVRKVHEALGVSTIDELKRACESGALAALPGFGSKTADNLLKGIENRIAYGMRHLWWDVRAVALPLIDGLRALPQVQRAEVAGSFRRGRETVGDLDFIVSSSDPEPVMQWFVSQPGVVEVSAHGNTKSSVRLEGGLQADLRVVPDDRFVFALHHFTGSKDHNVQMRQRALARGLSMSEWGFFNKDDEQPEGTKPLDRKLAVADIREEADLFAALGMAFVPPEMREGVGEVERAADGPLPALVEFDQLHGVFHNHTRASDGHASLEEMATAAAGHGWQYLGIADHSKASFQANGLSAELLIKQVEAIRALNEATAPGRAWLFAGCEVDILKDGSLDFGRDVTSQLDYCVVSVHASMSGLSEEEMTARMIRAIEADTGCFKILGHPTGRLLLRREGYAVHLHKLIDAAAANGVAIELNCSPWRMDMDWRYWRLAADRAVPCAINPDAHSTADLATTAHGVIAARKAGLQRSEILNTQSLGGIQKLFAASRRS